MAITPIVLFGSTQLTASPVILYTVPTNNRAVITKVTVTNVGSVAALVTFHIVRSGAGYSDSNIVIKTKTVGVGADAIMDALSGHTLLQGDTIHAFSDQVASVNVLGSGYVVT